MKSIHQGWMAILAGLFALPSIAAEAPDKPSPNRIAALGGSAGAHLAAWVALQDDLALLRDPPVPAVINDPHSAWHSVLLAEGMRKAGAKTTCRVGPEVGRSPEADNAAILKFPRENLLVTDRASAP